MEAKSTFLNLDEERQKQILDAALLEFTLNDYQNASLSKIISKLGLAKGSFYRYFDSKQDLYVYLLKYTTDFRFDDINELTSHKSLSLYEVILENFRMKIRFDKQYPLYSGFAYRVMSEPCKDVAYIKVELWQSVLGIIKSILNRFADEDQLNRVDIDIAAYSILQIQLGIFDFLEIHYQIDFLDNIKKGKPVFSLDDDKLMQVVEGFASVLSNGLVKK
jgi:AcrR family transcriptional regulator